MKDLPENAKKALEMIEEIEKEYPSETGNFENTKHWIKEKGVIEDRFLEILESKKRQLKIRSKR